MAFGTELKDFVAGFQTGFKLVEDARERASVQADRKSAQELREQQIEEAKFNNSPEMRDLDRRDRESTIGAREASTGYTGALTDKALYDNSPEARQRAIADEESTIDQRRSAARVNDASADSQEMENDQKRVVQDMIRKRLRGAGVDVPEPTSSSQQTGSAIPAGVSSLSPEDRDIAIRTIVGEAAGQSPEGQQAVANVILNRARSGRYGGGGVRDVVLAKNQFEPWSTRRDELMSLDPNSAAYKSAAAALDAALGSDVTNGATHFLNPDVVRERRGGSLPAWAQGESQTIGAHAFFAPEGRVADGSVGAARYSPAQSAISEMAGETKGKGGFRVAEPAVRAGLEYVMAEAGLTDAAVPADPQRQAEILRGAGAATADEMEGVEGIVKDVVGDREVSEAEQTILNLTIPFEVYTEMGMPEEAKKAAASILQYHRMLSGRYAALAVAAAEGGDVDGAIEAGVRAYANIPDGKDLKVNKKDGKYEVEFTDIETGKVLSKDVLSPQEMLGAALKVNPGSFDQFIITAAGEEYEKSSAITPQQQAIFEQRSKGEMPDYTGQDPAFVTQAEQFAPKPTSPGDYEKIDELVSNQLDMRLEQLGGPEALSATDQSVFKSVATELVKAGESPAGAMDVAFSITTVDPTDPHRPNFKLTKGEDGSYNFTLANGKSVSIPPAEGAMLIGIRGRRVRVARSGQRADAKGNVLERAASAIPEGSFKNPFAGMFGRAMEAGRESDERVRAEQAERRRPVDPAEAQASVIQRARDALASNPNNPVLRQRIEQQVKELGYDPRMIYEGRGQALPVP